MYNIYLYIWLETMVPLCDKPTKLLQSINLKVDVDEDINKVTIWNKKARLFSFHKRSPDDTSWHTTIQEDYLPSLPYIKI